MCIRDSLVHAPAAPLLTDRAAPEAGEVGARHAVEAAAPDHIATGLREPHVHVRVRQTAQGHVDHAFNRAEHAGPIERMVDVTLRRLANPYVDMWFAEAGGDVIGSGRLDRVPGTDFAGLWGGAIREEWRRRGVY